MEYGFHELCNLFPDMPEADYVRLRDDIRDNGLIHPIVLFEGVILDGKHRYRACQDLGIAPHFTEFSGASPETFVISENLMRRHLTAGQRASAAARLKEYYAEKAQNRKSLNGGNKKAEVENFPPPVQSQGKARDQAAASFGVSGRSVDDFISIKGNAIPAVVAAVDGGNMTIHEALSISKAKPYAQEKIVAIPDKKSRSKALREHQNRSRAKTAKKTALPEMAGPRGTEFVLYIIARLENMHAHRLDAGLSPGDYAKRFMEEFNWQAPELVSRLEVLADEVEAISMLQTMFRGASKRRAG